MASQTETASRSEDAVRLFFSYAKEDEWYRVELEKHLTTLKREGVIDTWTFREISAGHDWNVEISEHLGRADIVLFLISSDFMASQYCLNVEMKRALERHHRGECRVIPVILRHVDWRLKELRTLEALPRDATPVTDFESFDVAFEQIAEGIKAVAEEIRKARSEPVAEPQPAPGPRAETEQERVLDAALPGRLVQNAWSELNVLVRKKSSRGLKGILKADDSYSARPEDVLSKPLTIAFPTDASGRPTASQLRLKISAPDFDADGIEKILTVPPNRDSDICTFRLRPRMIGQFTVILEVYRNGQMASRRFRVMVDAVSQEVAEPPLLICIPMFVLVAPAGTISKVLAAAAASGGGVRAEPEAGRSFPSDTVSSPFEARDYGAVTMTTGEGRGRRPSPSPPTKPRLLSRKATVLAGLLLIVIVAAVIWQLRPETVVPIDQPTMIFGDVGDVTIANAAEGPHAHQFTYQPRGQGPHEWNWKYINQTPNPNPAGFGGVLYVSGGLASPGAKDSDGMDLSCCRTIEWDAQSVSGRVVVEFVAGGVNWRWGPTNLMESLPYPDSLRKVSLGSYPLTSDWKTYRYKFQGIRAEELKRVLGPFGFSISARSNGIETIQTDPPPPKFVIQIKNVVYRR